MSLQSETLDRQQQQDGNSFRYATRELKEDNGFCLAAVTSNWLAIKYVAEKNEQIVQTAKETYLREFPQGHLRQGTPNEDWDFMRSYTERAM